MEEKQGKGLYYQIRPIDCSFLKLPAWERMLIHADTLQRGVNLLREVLTEMYPEKFDENCSAVEDIQNIIDNG